MSRDFLIHNGKLTSDLDADGNQIKNLPGVAHLVDGKVPSDELPSYVDDVLEYATRTSFPATGERGKIYVALDTDKTYRWSGTQYTEIAKPTVDQTVTKNSTNPVASSGIWSAIWGALSALPTGFSSLYDWVADKLSGKLDASNGVATGLVTYLGTVNGFEYGLRFGSYGSDYAVQIVARSAGQQASWQATATLMVQKSKTGYAALLSDIPSVPSASTSTPNPDGTGSPGISNTYARGDHVHPSDSTKLDKSGGTMTGSLTLYEPQNGAEIYFPSGGKAKLQFGSGLLNVDDTTGRVTINQKDAAVVDNIPYDLVTKTIDNGAVTLDDRAINAVAVSSSLASLTVNFPTATSGKARDFGLRLTVASGITTAPELALPQGVTCENADGEAPEIGADGAATILYFTETASGVFLVKGEVLQTITQA